VVCEADESCYNGVCYPNAPAPADEAPACAGVDCGPNEACYLGTCYPLVAPADACPVGLPCRDGACPRGAFCYEGTCYPLQQAEEDPCSDTECEADELCYNGVCYQRVES
jgi:hypothetical protein